MLQFSFRVVWDWFQLFAIRVAMFMGFLILGPSIVLIVFDLLLYAYRTTCNSVPILRGREMNEEILETTVEKERLEDKSDGMGCVSQVSVSVSALSNPASEGVAEPGE